MSPNAVLMNAFLLLASGLAGVSQKCSVVGEENNFSSTFFFGLVLVGLQIKLTKDRLARGKEKHVIMYAHEFTKKCDSKRHPGFGVYISS